MLEVIKIGGISFAIKTDSYFENLIKKRLSVFAENRGSADVLFEIYPVADDDLILSPLEDKEKDRLSACIFPPFLGPGVLSIPVISPPTGRSLINSNPNNDPFNFPLLRSKMVRKKMNACLIHPEQVALALHHYSVTIRDYQSYTASVFYWDGCRDTIRTSEPHELLRRLFVSFLPAFSSMLVHASCLVRRNRAAMFLAPDEGGKTTVVGKAKRETVIGDDRIVIKKQENGIVAYGSPWGTIIVPSLSARVNAIFLLNKAGSFQLKKIDATQVVEYLWHEHRYDRFFLTSKLKSVVFELIVDLCRQANVYQMDFSKDYVDWDAVEAIMEGHLDK